MCFLKELDASNTPQHTFSHFMQEIWMTLKNLTTCYLVIFVLGTQALTNFVFNVNIYLQVEYLHTCMIVGVTRFN